VSTAFSRFRKVIPPNVSVTSTSPEKGTMGGKTWSFEEERFFWNDLIPQSPKGVNPAKRILDWEMCARRMQAAMGAQARRRYTKLMLCGFVSA
jgi:hypothetical protein